MCAGASQEVDEAIEWSSKVAAPIVARPEVLPELATQRPPHVALLTLLTLCGAVQRLQEWGAEDILIALSPRNSTLPPVTPFDPISVSHRPPRVLACLACCSALLGSSSVGAAGDAATLAAGMFPHVQPWAVLKLLDDGDKSGAAAGGPDGWVALAGGANVLMAATYLGALFQQRRGDGGAVARQLRGGPRAWSRLVLALAELLMRGAAPARGLPRLSDVLLSAAIVDADVPVMLRVCVQWGSKDDVAAAALRCVVQAAPLQGRNSRSLSLSGVDLEADESGSGKHDVELGTACQLWQGRHGTALSSATQAAVAAALARSQLAAAPRQAIVCVCMLAAVDGGEKLALLSALALALEGSRATQSLHTVAAAHAFCNLEHGVVLEVLAALAQHEPDGASVVSDRVLGWLADVVGPLRACQVLLKAPLFVSRLQGRDSFEYLVEWSGICARCVGGAREIVLLSRRPCN